MVTNLRIVLFIRERTLFPRVSEITFLPLSKISLRLIIESTSSPRISGLRKSRGMVLTNLAIVRWTLIAMPGTRAAQIAMDWARRWLAAGCWNKCDIRATINSRCYASKWRAKWWEDGGASTVNRKTTLRWRKTTMWNTWKNSCNTEHSFSLSRLLPSLVTRKPSRHIDIIHIAK